MYYSKHRVLHKAVIGKIKAIVRSFLNKKNAPPSTGNLPKIDPNGQQVIHQVFAANRQAQWTYKPPPYAGRITCFWAADIKFPVLDTRPGWVKYSTQPLDIHTIPGQHAEFIKEPYVHILAEKLQPYLSLNATEQS